MREWRRRGLSTCQPRTLVLGVLVLVGERVQLSVQGSILRVRLPRDTRDAGFCYSSRSIGLIDRARIMRDAVVRCQRFQEFE